MLWKWANGQRYAAQLDVYCTADGSPALQDNTEANQTLRTDGNQDVTQKKGGQTSIQRAKCLRTLLGTCVLDPAIQRQQGS